MAGFCRPALTSSSITQPPGNPPELTWECTDSPSSMKSTSLSRRSACSMAGGRGVRHNSAAEVGLTLRAGCGAVLAVDVMSEGLKASVPCFSPADVACSGCSFGGTMAARPPNDSESVSVCLDGRALLRLRNANPAARQTQNSLHLTASQLLYVAAVSEKGGQGLLTRAATYMCGDRHALSAQA